MSRSNLEDTSNVVATEMSRTSAEIFVYRPIFSCSPLRSEMIAIVPAFFLPTNTLRCRVRASASNRAPSSLHAGICRSAPTPSRRYSARTAPRRSYKQAATIWCSARSAASASPADLESLNVSETAVLAPKISAKLANSLVIADRNLNRSYNSKLMHARLSPSTLVQRNTNVSLRRMEDLREDCISFFGQNPTGLHSLLQLPNQPHAAAHLCKRLIPSHLAFHQMMRNYSSCPGATHLSRPDNLHRTGTLMRDLD